MNCFDTCVARFLAHSNILMQASGFSIKSPLEAYDGTYAFYPTGEIASIDSRTIRGTTKGTFSFETWNATVNLGLDGKLQKVAGRIYDGAFVTGSGQQIQKGSRLYFFSDESIAVMTLESDIVFPTSTGTQSYRPGQRVKLDVAGKVIDFCDVDQKCAF